MSKNDDYDAISGFKCCPCSSNTIKVVKGDGPCKHCNGRLSVDNGLGTECVGPYTNKSLSLDNDMKYIELTLMSISSMLAITFLYTNSAHS